MKVLGRPCNTASCAYVDCLSPRANGHDQLLFIIYLLVPTVTINHYYYYYYLSPRANGHHQARGTRRWSFHLCLVVCGWMRVQPSTWTLV